MPRNISSSVWILMILLEFFDFPSRFIMSGSIISLISLRLDLSWLLLILLSYQCPGCSCSLSHRGTITLAPQCIEPSLSSFCSPAAVLVFFSDSFARLSLFSCLRPFGAVAHLDRSLVVDLLLATWPSEDDLQFLVQPGLQFLWRTHLHGLHPLMDFTAELGHDSSVSLTSPFSVFVSAKHMGQCESRECIW